MSRLDARLIPPKADFSAPLFQLCRHLHPVQVQKWSFASGQATAFEPDLV